MAIVVGGVTVDLSANSGQIVTEMERAARATVKASQQMQGGLTKWAGGFGRVEGQLRGFASRVTGTFRGITRAVGAIGIGGGLLGGGFAIAAKRAITSADAIAKAADRAGISTKAYQELEFAASQTGVGQDKLNTALVAFGRRVAEAREGIGPLVGIFKNLNPELLRSLQATTSQEGALRVFARAMGETTDQAKRLSLAQAAFSETGRALTLTFADGAAGIDAYATKAQRLGLVISDDLLRGAEDANDAFDTLGRTIGTQFTTAILSVAPALGRLATGLAESIPSVIKWGVEWGKALGVLSLTEIEKVDAVTADIAALTLQINDFAAAGGDSALLETMKETRAYMVGYRQDLIDTAQLERSLATGAGAGAGGGAGSAGGAPQRPSFTPIPRPGGKPSLGAEAFSDQLRMLHDSMGDVTPPAPEIDDATASMQNLANATIATAGAVAGLNAAMANFGSGNLAQNAGALITSLGQITAAAVATAVALAAARTAGYDYTAVVSVIAAGAAVAGALLSTVGGIMASREHGGPVGAGQPYIVGERGQELFVPDRSGSIVSNAALREMGSGSTSTVRLEFVGEGGDMRRAVRDPRARRAIAEAVAREFRANPALRGLAVRGG